MESRLRSRKSRASLSCGDLWTDQRAHGLIQTLVNGDLVKTDLEVYRCDPPGPSMRRPWSVNAVAVHKQYICSNDIDTEDNANVHGAVVNATASEGSMLQRESMDEVIQWKPKERSDTEGNKGGVMHRRASTLQWE